MYLKVEGNSDLVRDMNTRAIINTNSTEYEKYLMNKQRIEDEKNQLLKNSEDINTLKQELLEIKQLLLLTLQNKGHI